MVRIVTDTTSGLPLDVARELGIPMLPQIIVFGETSYRDDTELDTATFLEKLRNSPVLPKTSSSPPGLYGPIFEKMAADGHTILCLHPSTEVSGTVRSAEVAAQAFPTADIRVVDTRTIAAPLTAMVLLADKWAKDGLDAATITARVHDLIARQEIFFVVDTLEYLRRGGRIGAARALLGSLLQVKPILTLEDGQVAPFEQQRTARRALARLRELVLERCPHTDDAHLSIMHADAADTARALAAEFEQGLGLSRVPVYELPPAIVVHGGPGILAASFFTLS